MQAIRHIRRVFQAIVNEWLSHVADIERLVLRTEEEKEKWKKGAPGRRQWSFELELNRWAREGCRRRAGWASSDTALTGSYPNGRMSADALVTAARCDPVPVEIKLVTNVTMDKWIDKINDDTAKLIGARYRGLQVIVCVDTFDMEKSKSWIGWLNRIHVWNVNTPMMLCQRILEAGKLLIKGWAIPRDQAWLDDLVNQRVQPS